MSYHPIDRDANLPKSTKRKSNELISWCRNFYRQSLELWKNLKQDKVVASLEEKIAKLEAN
jgi:hypothetical protein